MKKSRWFGIAASSLAVFGLAAVFLPAFVYWKKLGSFDLASEQEVWAYLGEYFGGVTGPILALLALIALAVTLYLQALELEETRTEANRQRVAFDRQTFEGTLFQLINQFREVARAVHIQEDRPDGYSGREAFAKIYGSMRTKYVPHKLYPPAPDRDMQTVQEIYRDKYNEYQSELGPYFRSLYHIFKHIDQSARTKDDKAHYASIARAQLSSNEVLVLFYNGTWGEGQDFRRLIEEYGILKHVPQDQLLRGEHMDYREWYAVSAFQDFDDRKSGSPNPSAVNARGVRMAAN